MDSIRFGGIQWTLWAALLCGVAQAEDGGRLWLRYER